MDTTTAVKEGQGAATVEEGVKINQQAPTDADLLAQLADKDKELEKVRSDRDNYRKGLLSVKGKLKNEDGEDVDIQDIVHQAVKEQMASHRESQIQTEKDELIKKSLREKDELITALKNRSQISATTTQTSTETKTVVQDNVLSEEKIQKFKSMGKTDAWIETYKKTIVKNGGFIK